MTTGIASNARPVLSGMPKFPCRPNCPKCGMNMFGTSSGNKKTYECMRCGHVEARGEKK
jgi:hypothetical protein